MYARRPTLEEILYEHSWNDEGQRLSITVHLHDGPRIRFAQSALPEGDEYSIAFYDSGRLVVVHHVGPDLFVKDGHALDLPLHAWSEVILYNPAAEFEEDRILRVRPEVFS